MRLVSIFNDFNFTNKKCESIPVSIALALTLIVVSACAGTSGSSPAGVGSDTLTSRITQCKASDSQVQSSQQCLQDDAACYQLSNGQWCTGERGNTCPAGSTSLPADQACPLGSNCFTVGESLQCAIN